MLSVGLPGSVGAGSVVLSAVGDDRVGSGSVVDGAVVGGFGIDCVGPGVSTSSAPQLAMTSTSRPAVVAPRIRRDQRDLAADRASYTWGTLSSPPTTFVESCSRSLSSCNGATPIFCLPLFALCRLLIVTLNDGTQHRANFEFVAVEEE